MTEFINLLILRGNKLPIPPEILEKTNEPESILKYYFERQNKPTLPLNEVKLLLVGQGSVGKSSLLKKLSEAAFNIHERKTEGIDIVKLEINLGKEKIKLNVWDFGGQEIMHATHQFFLTKRSVFILVLDNRLSEDENRLEYWLKIIQAFGGDSPIIIVGNKLDQQHLDIDRQGLIKKYKNIKGVFETSCLDGRGITELKRGIASTLLELPHIHDQILMSWFEIKRQLETLKEDYIPYVSYMQMCGRMYIKDAISQKTLIGFLHDLGVVFNFGGDPRYPRLEDTNILNPEWVTSGVYKIINSNELFQAKGVLKYYGLGDILDPIRYPITSYMFILDMMRKFELCFEFEDENEPTFWIPDLLTKEEPYTGEWDNALSFEFKYNILPTSVISRFIVRSHHYIQKNTVWRNGVLLDFSSSNQALVKADYEERSIHIYIRGGRPTRRDVLSGIRSQFDSIHRSIPGLEILERIAIHNKETVDFLFLLQLEQEGRKSFPFAIEGKIVDINVNSLLSGAELISDSTSSIDEPNITKTNVEIAEPNFSINHSDNKTRLNNQKSSSAYYRLLEFIFITIPKYIGKTILILIARTDTDTGVSILIGYVVIGIILLLTTGLLTFDTITKLKDSIFKPK